MNTFFASEITDDISKACCFTGHRSVSATTEEIKKRVLCEIETLINDKGVVNFYAGGALGFDTLAAQCVLELKGKYPFIKLILALPCKRQHSKWSTKEKATYESILSSADKVHYVCDTYSEDCMFFRNDYMVEHSLYCICFLRRLSGGTYYTVTKAKKLGRELIML